MLPRHLSPLLVCVVLAGACEPRPGVGRVTAASHECSRPTDSCDDGELCTTDQCDLVAGACIHITIPACCVRIEDCGSAPRCSVYACEMNVCTPTRVPGCDAGPADLDAGSPPDAGGTEDAGAVRDAGSEDAGRSDAGPSDAAVGSEVDGGSRDEAPRVRGGACSVGGPGPGGLWLVALLGLLGSSLRRRRAGVVAGVVLVALCAVPSVATAQDTFRLSRDPAPLPDDLGTLERAAPRGAMVRPGLRVSIAYLDDPLVAERGDAEQPIVDERLRLDLAATLAFLDRAFVTVRGSLHVQGGLGRGAVDAANPGLESPAIGAPTFDARVVILDRAEPLELAVAATLRLPYGSADGFVIDPEVSVAPRLLAARQLDDDGSFIGLSTGFDVRPSVPLGDVMVGPMWTFALGGALALSPQAALTLELTGATVLDRAFDLAHTPLRGALGFRWLEEPFSLAAWAGAGLTPGFGSPDAVVGLAFGAWIPVS